MLVASSKLLNSAVDVSDEEANGWRVFVGNASGEAYLYKVVSRLSVPSITYVEGSSYGS